MTKAERLARAFAMGVAWSLGRAWVKNQALAQDAKRDMRDVRWVTINGTHVPISKKTGEIVGHLKEKIDHGYRHKVSSKRGLAARKALSHLKDKDAKNALLIYSKDTSQEAFYRRVNHWLRHDNPIPKCDEKVAKVIDRYLDGNRTFAKMVVYRGLPKRAFDSDIANGELFNKGYNSGSYDIKVAKKFARDRLEKSDDIPMVLEMVVPKGFPAAYMTDISEFKDEKEILLPRSVRGKVVKERMNRGYRIITVDLYEDGYDVRGKIPTKE